MEDKIKGKRLLRGITIFTSFHAIKAHTRKVKRKKWKKIRELKKAYRAKDSWTRVTELLNGKVPKWRKLKKLSIKELDNLVETYEKTQNWEEVQRKINDRTLIKKSIKEEKRMK